MAFNYQVLLTTTAEQDYERYSDQSEQGKDGKPIGLISTIDKAIDETLAVSPINSAFALAGSLSFIFMMSLGPVCIYYIAYAEHGVTYIVHIGDNQQGADLSFIYQPVKDGEEETEAMLQRLGIESSLLLDDDKPLPWLN
ncbi:MAG TPA: hypothetical protein VNO50_17425 [Pyrinomonadaceae bacterium]|nr:hypothetical protein [Pyrinomonadaceae bacterium]